MATIIDKDAQELADALTSVSGGVRISEKEYLRAPLLRVYYTLREMRAAGWPAKLNKHGDIEIERGRIDVTTIKDEPGLIYTWLV